MSDLNDQEASVFSQQTLEKYCELAECNVMEAVEMLDRFLDQFHFFDESEDTLAIEIVEQWVRNILPVATRYKGKSSRKLSKDLLWHMLTHYEGDLDEQKALFAIALVQKYFFEAVMQ